MKRKFTTKDTKHEGNRESPPLPTFVSFVLFVVKES